MKKKVMVAMSGGVDSSVAALMMIEQGHDVAGITMVMDEKLTDYNESAAVRDARKVAGHLEMLHFVEDTSTLFKKRVLDNFVESYAKGQTPNPCVQCNRYVKFGRLLERAVELGYDYLVTGHYASIDGGVLGRGKDPRKDQSYFLYPIYSVETSRILFPLGTFEKTQIRQMAIQASLPVAHKEESQDICFIPGDDYGSFLRQNGLQSKTGDIVDVTGRKIGVHQGISNYTVGQRKGLGALGQRMFVKEIIPENNTVVAATDSELNCTIMTVNGVIARHGSICEGMTYAVQVRYRSKPTDAKIIESNGDCVKVSFTGPVRAIAPGQSAVFYDGDKVIGGGIISSAR